MLAVLPARADAVAKGVQPAVAYWHRNPDGVTGWTDWHAERYWVVEEESRWAQLPFGATCEWEEYVVRWVSRDEWEGTYVNLGGAEDE